MNFTELSQLGGVVVIAVFTIERLVFLLKQKRNGNNGKSAMEQCITQLTTATTQLITAQVTQVETLKQNTKILESIDGRTEKINTGIEVIKEGLK